MNKKNENKPKANKPKANVEITEVFENEVFEQEPMEEVKENIVVKEEKPFNPLSKGRVIAKFILKKRGIAEKGHPYYGNYTPDSKTYFCLPQDEDERFINFLTPEEERFYEDALGLNRGDLNVNKIENNFWKSDNKNGISRFFLQKQDTYFDKSNPKDMLKLAVLKANKDVICKSPRELEENPKPTYMWVLVDEEAQFSEDENLTSLFMDCSKILSDLYQDKWALKYIVEKVQKVTLSPRTSLTQLQGKMWPMISSDIKSCHKVMSDPQLSVKSNIAKAKAYSIINNRNGFLFYNNRPLCWPGMDATEKNAANYLSDRKNVELYADILDKIPNE